MIRLIPFSLQCIAGDFYIGKCFVSFFSLGNTNHLVRCFNMANTVQFMLFAVVRGVKAVTKYWK